MIKLQILFLFLFAAVIELAAGYKRIKDYRQYNQEWRKVVPKEYIHNVSELGLGSQQCYGKKCQFYYYQYVDESIKDAVRQRTIMMVSGMHGDEYLGPHTLLYAYKHLKAYRILYFPMANPSGFLQNTRQTHPSKIDLNRDFPIDSNTICYQASATFILEMLYRKYPIDLTIAVHNGGVQIGYNWGTYYHLKNDHTVEYPMNKQIAQMMRKVGGKTSKLPQYQIGTMTKVVYPAQGTFDDWAYAAARYPQIVTKCVNYQHKPYPVNMTNGLVFLIEMGPKKYAQFGTQQGIYQSPLSQSKHNGHVSRTIRILKSLMDIISPKLVFKWSNINNNLKIYVKGCHNASIYNLKLQKWSNKTWLFRDYFQYNKKVDIQGTLRSSQPNLTTIQLNTSNGQNDILKLGDRIRYTATLHCDASWMGLGSTFFATKRVYQLNEQQQIKIYDQLQQILDTNIASTFMQDTFLSNVSLLELAVAGCLALLIFYIVVRVKRQRQQSRKGQKFEEPSSQKNFEQSGDGDMQGDLHTARGGIIQM